MGLSIHRRRGALCAGASLLAILVCQPALAEDFTVSGSSAVTNGGFILSDGDTLTVTSTGVVDVNDSGSFASTTALETSANNTTITNNGAVFATAIDNNLGADANATASGMFADDSDIRLVNAGTLDAKATATGTTNASANANAYGQYLDRSYPSAAVSGNLTNSGKIGFRYLSHQTHLNPKKHTK